MFGMGTGVASPLKAPAISLAPLPGAAPTPGGRSAPALHAFERYCSVRAPYTPLSTFDLRTASPSHAGAQPMRPRPVGRVPGNERGQANRQISTGKLNALLRVHLRPINLVVFEVPQGISSLGVGFTLICLQRLSFRT